MNLCRTSLILRNPVHDRHAYSLVRELRTCALQGRRGMPEGPDKIVLYRTSANEATQYTGNCGRDIPISYEKLRLYPSRATWHDLTGPLRNFINNLQTYVCQWIYGAYTCSSKLPLIPATFNLDLQVIYRTADILQQIPLTSGPWPESSGRLCVRLWLHD